MRLFRNLPALVALILLALCIAGLYSTRDTGSQTGGKKAAAEAAPLVDDRLAQTARELARIADTPGEQDQALQAMHLADHELDQAFATAMREATASAPAPTAAMQKLAARIDELKAAIAADQARTAELAKAAETSEDAADLLQLAKAQLALDQDELSDAQQDRAREGGDRHARVERALAEHEAQQKETVQMPKLVDPTPPAALFREYRLWASLGDRKEKLRAAAREATQEAAGLTARHNSMENQMPTAAKARPGAAEDTSSAVMRLRRMADERKMLADFDKRIQDIQQLATVYGTWEQLVDERRRAAAHSLLRGLLVVLLVVLAAIGVDRALRRVFHNTDRKRLHQLRTISTIAVQLAAVGIVVLLVFGAPTDVSTMIGLVTAGLAVVLKDFIVAFFGWFALMGKNGIRVGDWVEIEGVSGEVIDIGVLKTVLLEMGSGSSGHPTGRRVAFPNSYAIEGHYFNFSTAGQWLWDEIRVALPGAGDPFAVAQQIREVVERETQPDAAEAAADWERVTKDYGVSGFSAAPSSELRPAGSGLEVVVRYITRAPQRNAMKSRLFHSIVDLLHKSAIATD